MTTSQSDSSRLLPADDGDGCRIIRVRADRLEEALDRLLAVHGTAEAGRARRFMEFARDNAIKLDTIWSLVDESDRVVETVFVVPNPGKTAMFFASHPVAPIEVKPLARLIDRAVTEVRGMGVHLAQTLLEPSERLEHDAFLGAGFTELARLSYMDRPMPKRREMQPVAWPSGLRVEEYARSRDGELLRALEESYEGTLDCPGLRGLRETKDILEGHRATGVFDPALWSVLYEGHVPCGALLLNPSPQHRSVELVYLGLTPRARGRGLGKLLLQHGFALLASREERRINLAVDEQNTPAIALYNSMGFARSQRRIALVRSLRAR